MHRAISTIFLLFNFNLAVIFGLFEVLVTSDATKILSQIKHAILYCNGKSSSSYEIHLRNLRINWCHLQDILTSMLLLQQWQDLQ